MSEVPRTCLLESSTSKYSCPVSLPGRSFCEESLGFSSNPDCASLLGSTPQLLGHLGMSGAGGWELLGSFESTVPLY